jgi:hypothetical protein
MKVCNQFQLTLLSKTAVRDLRGAGVPTIPSFWKPSALEERTLQRSRASNADRAQVVELDSDGHLLCDFVRALLTLRHELTIRNSFSRVCDPEQECRK